MKSDEKRQNNIRFRVNRTNISVTASTAVAYHADERSARGVGDCLGHHRLPRTRRPVHQNASGGVDPDLLVQLEMRQREFHRFLHL